MTPLDEQARALVTELWHRAQPGGYERKTLDDWKNEGTLLIATALRQQWLETAREADRIVQVADAAIEDCDGDEWIPLNTIIAEFLRFGIWCRQRAKE